MQFTVLIEFLIPGLATVLLCLALVPGTMIQLMQPDVLGGDTARALVLLAISYPVGHLINFPIYRLVQWELLAPRARRRTVQKWVAARVDLAELASQELGFRVAHTTKEELRELFYYMQTSTFSRNIEQFKTHDLFHKSLQRLARGILFPLLLVAALNLRQNGVSPFSLFILLVILVSAIVFVGLWNHFVQIEENEIARFFVVNSELRPIPGIKVTALTHPGGETGPETSDRP